MERQPDDEGRAVIGDILSINTDLDDEGLMQMAQDCLKKLRRERLEKKWTSCRKACPPCRGTKGCGDAARLSAGAAADGTPVTPPIGAAASQTIPLCT